jgi:uncharacterized protein YecE (DUF72 family)
MIRLGPAGWAYKDWSGIVYPLHRPRGFHEATFLARYFDTIELNVAFYRPIAPATAASWVAKVEANPRFRYTAKLWQVFTHDRSVSDEHARIVDEGLRPLREAGRLGALLMQFPFSFHNTRENRDHVLRLAERFAAYPLVLEVRHASWHDDELVTMLREAHIGLSNIDQPLFAKSIAPSSEATSTVGYVRLHGRNAEHWWTREMRSTERYDYLYTPEELQPWVHRIEDVAANTDDVYVIANNHYLGKAVVNALELTALVRGAPVAAPRTLLARYPALGAFARAEPESEPEPLALFAEPTP